jgi:single-stranded-DNA-specific exonuclease
MSTPDIAAELLLLSGERDADRARALAESLNEANTRRQEEEAAILVRARTLVDKDPDVGGHNVLVVAGEGWHRGVIGIVASKLVDAYCKPAIVLSIEGDVAHGSCRSVPGFDMLDALERCAELFDRFGGHRQAAGLAMSPGRIPEFRARVNAHADAVLDPGDLMPRLRLDGRLPLSEITPALLEGLERMAPFGLSNPAPVFASGPVSLGDGPARLKEKHLSMSVRDRGFLFRAIAWRGVEWEGFLQSHRDSVEVAAAQRNTFRGQQIERCIAAVREPRRGHGRPSTAAPVIGTMGFAGSARARASGCLPARSGDGLAVRQRTQPPAAPVERCDRPSPRARAANRRWPRARSRITPSHTNACSPTRTAPARPRA